MLVVPAMDWSGSSAWTIKSLDSGFRRNDGNGNTRMTTVYGLPTCDTCRKARNWLDRFGVAHTFVDYRAHPIPAATLKEWAKQLGGWEKLVNRASITWRNLLPQRKNPQSDPEWTLLLKEYPALIRRPVTVLDDDTVRVGFSDNGFKRLFLLPARGEKVPEAGEGQL